MARPVGRPRYDAKQKLTAAMRELLAERGYTATSPKMVLDRAKLGQGSLYYHFAGKEELATATITTLMDRSLTILTEDLDSDDDPDSGTPTEGSPRGVLEVSRIETALTGLLSRREGSALVRLLADPAATHPGPLADAIAVWVHALRLLLTSTLEDAQDKPGAAGQAEKLLTSAVGRQLLRIGTADRLPR